MVSRSPRNARADATGLTCMRLWSADKGPGCNRNDPYLKIGPP